LETAHRDGMSAEERAAKCPETMLIIGLSAEAGSDYEREAGLYKLIQLMTLSFESAWFQPSNL
jgi:hypothetical protein